MFADKAQEKKNLLFKACYRGKVRANPFWGGRAPAGECKIPVHSPRPTAYPLWAYLVLDGIAVFPAKTPSSAQEQAGRFKGMGFLLAEFLQVFW